MPAEFCLVLCTCPDAVTARALAQALVEQHQATCVNILPGVTSVYPWEGRIESAAEQLLLIKTTTLHYERLERFIKAHHPYDIPEIIAMPIERGSSDYLGWLRAWLGSPA